MAGVDLTKALAIYAAITSTIAVAVVIIRYFFHERPRLKLQLLHGYEMFAAGQFTTTTSSCTYSRLIITNLGRETTSVNGAYMLSVVGGELKMLLFADSIEAKPRALNPENPRTEYMVEEKGFDRKALVMICVNDGFGRTHKKWLVKGQRNREAKYLLREFRGKKVSA